MKKALLPVGLGLATVLLPFNGRAEMFVDYDSFFLPPLVTSAQLNFNIVDATGDADTGSDVRGFNPATMVVTGAVATFQLGDAGDDTTREVQVTFDGDYSFTESWTFGGGDLFTTAGMEPLTTNLKTLIQADGQVVVDITSLQGEFSVISGRLDVTAVPEPRSSLILTGLALLAFQCLRSAVVQRLHNP